MKNILKIGLVAVVLTAIGFLAIDTETVNASENTNEVVLLPTEFVDQNLSINGGITKSESTSSEDVESTDDGTQKDGLTSLDKTLISSNTYYTTPISGGISSVDSEASLQYEVIGNEFHYVGDLSLIDTMYSSEVSETTETSISYSYDETTNLVSITVSTYEL